jgi:transcriptional regulator with XRE-family HTH domain/tetratricopeptide (TPR) repeat protein
MGESFGSMLRRHRVAASLTQEQLAERASLSATAVAALERGRSRAPRLSTLRQLARSLDLGREELAELSHAASADGDVVGRGVDGDGSSAPAVTERSTWTTAAPEAPASADGRDVARLRIPLPPAARRRWRTDFVGRTKEMARLGACWDERRRLTEVVGESGIGKTRLVAEVAQRAYEDGATVVWGRGNQDRLGPYLPFVEILRHLVTFAEPVALKAAVGAYGELTRLVPDLADRVGPLPAPTRADAGSEQRLLFEAASAVLAGWMPMLLVIDDLHWADEATLALLTFLVRDQRVDELVVMVTARPADLDAVTSGRLADLGRDADMVRLPLVGLDTDDLAALVGGLMGSPAPSQLVQSVSLATDGNPFFAEEMIVHIVDSGMVYGPGGDMIVSADVKSAGVPVRVRDTVVRRLSSLSDDGIELLSVGSVIGREFELSVVAGASGLGGPILVDAADDGLLSGMVIETEPGKLAFSHALVRDVVCGRLSYARRAGIHRRVAEALEDRWPGNPAAATDLAHHWAAVAVIDPSTVTTAATWAVRAGDIALAAAAAEEAIAQYQQACTLWATATSGHADALIRLGLALQYRGRVEDGDARFREAIQLSIALGDPCLQARAAIGLGQRYPYWETDTERVEALEAALAGLPPEEPLLRVRLMGLLVTHLINGFEDEHARRRDTLADELAGIAADTSTSQELLLAVGQTRIYDCIEDPVKLTAVAHRLAGIARANSDLRVLAGARFAEALASLDLGKMEQLLQAIERFDEAAARLDDPRERGQAAMVRSTIAFIEGRYDDAATMSDEALHLGHAAGDFNAELLNYAQGLLRAVDQGQAADVLPLLLDAATSEYQHIASFVAGTALCAALAGEHDLARSSLERVVASGFEGLPRGADWLAPTAFLAHTCTIVGAVPEAEKLYQSLSNALSPVVRVGPLAGWWGPVDHHLGCLARLLGRPDEAEARLLRALDIERHMAARPFAARTHAELARLLAASSPERAQAMATEAIAIAHAIGAAGISAEVHAAVGNLATS